MGEVHRALDTRLDRYVALKILPEAFAANAERVARLQREAKVLASLNHPHIAAIYGLEDTDGVCALVMELVEGEDLAQRLARGAIPVEEALLFAKQIADALEAAHKQGIVHRDLKPANVKVTPEGRVRVLDFGIAKFAPRDGVLDAASRLSTSPMLHTEPGAIVGTPPYMSPEQIRGQITDQQTDVWAFGCVVYELLSGRRPFRGSTAPDIIVAILQGEPDWHDLPANVPEAVRTLLRRCLEKDASRRWQGFNDVRREMARAIAALMGHEQRRRRIILLCGVVPVALAGLLALSNPAMFGRLDNAVYDAMLRWSTTPPPDPRVVVVDIDERSLTTIGQWPWRRDVVGRLISRLRDLGAATIALDFLFAEPDRYQELVSAGDESSPGRRGTPDELFADSLRPGKVVLGNAMTFKPGASAGDSCELHPINLVMRHPQEVAHSNATPFFEATGSVCSLKPLVLAAGQSGFLNGAPDSDGILRRAPLVIGLNSQIYPSLAVAAVSTATAVRNGALRIATANHVLLTLDQHIVPLDGKSNLMLRYRGPKRTFPYVSAADVMSGRAPFESIKDKIVFVGTTALGTREVVATPLDTLFVGVEVQATVADNLLQLDFVHRPVSGTTLESVAALGLGAAVVLLVVTLGLSAGGVAAMAGLTALWLGAVWLLSTRGVFLSPLYSTAGVVLAFVSMTVAKFAVERRRAETAIRNVESAVLDG